MGGPASATFGGEGDAECGFGTTFLLLQLFYIPSLIKSKISEHLSGLSLTLGGICEGASRNDFERLNAKNTTKVSFCSFGGVVAEEME